MDPDHCVSNPSATSTTRDSMECAIKCAGTEGCRGATYDEETKKCQLVQSPSDLTACNDKNKKTYFKPGKQLSFAILLHLHTIIIFVKQHIHLYFVMTQALAL